MASPAITIESPLDRAVHQRGQDDRARVLVSGRISGIPKANSCHVSCKVTGPERKSVTSQSLPVLEGTSRFAGEITLPSGGWYAVHLDLLDGEGRATCSASVEHVGVGEVFITAGQSNSANSGTVHLAPKSDLVSARTTTGWVAAADPQPVAAGEGGTPWPPMADALVDALHVPVGLVSVGVGGTAVATWIPGGKRPRWKWLARFFKQNNFPRLEWAVKVMGTRGARAVLWHQGESDSIARTNEDTYAARLHAVIDGSRAAAGWNVPWLVARASFHTSPKPEEMQAVVNGQAAVVDNKDVFQGPTTDDMLGEQWRAPDLVHFNGAGLAEHGRRNFLGGLRARNRDSARASAPPPPASSLCAGQSPRPGRDRSSRS